MERERRDLGPACQPSTPAIDRRGLLCGFACYAFWGLVPLYFKSVAHVLPLEVLAHRIVWSVLLLAALLVWARRWHEVARCFRSWVLLPALFGSTLLIAINWFVYIYGVSTGQVLETSLGYFMNPLLSIVLGMLVFGERLRPLQWLAVALALAGVLYLAVAIGRLPWIALGVAFSFGFYGMVRKLVPVETLVGISVETFLLLPFAAIFLAYRAQAGTAAWGRIDRDTDLLLVASGAVTALPLLLFGEAARRLPLSMLGFLQYLSPSLAFVLAVVVFREPFSSRQLVSFTCIWIALALYSTDSLTSYRRRRSRKSAPKPADTKPAPLAIRGQLR